VLAFTCSFDFLVVASPTPADTADITDNILLLCSRSVIEADDADPPVRSCLRFDSAAAADATSLVLFFFPDSSSVA
jgi:hypothetical protein